MPPKPKPVPVNTSPIKQCINGICKPPQPKK